MNSPTVTTEISNLDNSERAALLTTTKPSLAASSALKDVIQNRSTADDETISSFIENAVFTLKACAPLIQEMQRRFENLDRTKGINGRYHTIRGCRSFKEYCQKILKRTEQGVYKMLREEKFFTALKKGDKVSVKSGRDKEVWTVDGIEGDKVCCTDTRVATIVFDKYTGKSDGGQKLLGAVSPASQPTPAKIQADETAQRLQDSCRKVGLNVNVAASRELGKFHITYHNLSEAEIRQAIDSFKAVQP